MLLRCPASTAIRGRYSWVKDRSCLFSAGQAVFDHVPDRIPVDPEIVVDEDTPHPDDGR
jgi:hypothetical protein